MTAPTYRPFEIDNTVTQVIDRTEPGRGPVVDAARLWSGGLATAGVAALVGLVGSLVVQVVTHLVPGAHLAAFSGSAIGLLCALAAVAALAATGIAHLLLLSTPRPLEYLGWITGLATAAAAVLPFALAGSVGQAAAQAVVYLVVGLSVATLTGSAAAASRR